MENNVISCRLKIPSDTTGITPVFLVNFTNGCINFSKSDTLNFNCYRQGSDESLTKRVLCAKGDRLKFKSVPHNDNYCADRFRYFVGLRKKNSNKMKVYESASFHLNPIRNSFNTSLSSENKSIREKLDDLASSFGSKEKKRSMAARQKYFTDTSQLDDTLEDISLDESHSKTNLSSPSNKSSTNIDYIPPQNREATFINEVYRIQDLIPIEIDEYLAERAEELLRDVPTHFARWKTDLTFSEYILQHMETELDPTKMKYLLFCNYLVKFSNLLSSDIRKKDPAPEIPEPVKSYLIETFTVSSVSENGRTSRAFPLKMKDKLLAYIIVIALFIDDCVNLALLQNGTKVSNVAQTVGCYISRYDAKLIQ